MKVTDLRADGLKTETQSLEEYYGPDTRTFPDYTLFRRLPV